MKKLLIAGMINLLLLNIVLAEDKWQYIIYQHNYLLQTTAIQHKLNSYGEDGWELITVTLRPYFKGINDGPGRVYYFKKKIENEDK